MAEAISTAFLRVGIGPPGLMLAIERCCSGIACVVRDEDAGSPSLRGSPTPK